MLKLKLFYLYFIYSLCKDFYTEDYELIILKKNNDSSMQNNFLYKISQLFNKNENKKQEIINKKINENLTNLNIVFKESYEDASKCLILIYEEFKKIKNTYSKFSVYERNFPKKISNILSKNFNIDSKNLSILIQLLNYDYFEYFSNLITILFNYDKINFEKILNIKNIENNIDLCFYRLSKFFNEYPKIKSKNVFLYDINRFFLDFIDKTSNLNNISNINRNNLVIYLFSPYFISHYIYYSFIKKYLYNILIFFINNDNKKIDKKKYNFYISNYDNGEFFFIFENKLMNLKMNLNIKRILNDIDDQNYINISLLDFKIIYDDKKCFKNTLLITKNNLKSIIKKDSKLLVSFLTKNK